MFYEVNAILRSNLRYHRVRKLISAFLKHCYEDTDQIEKIMNLIQSGSFKNIQDDLTDRYPKQLKLLVNSSYIFDECKIN